MREEIETYIGTCYTIVFINKSFNPPLTYVLVCANQDAYHKHLQRVQGLPHLEIVTSGLSSVAR